MPIQFSTCLAIDRAPYWYHHRLVFGHETSCNRTSATHAVSYHQEPVMLLQMYWNSEKDKKNYVKTHLSRIIVIEICSVVTLWCRIYVLAPSKSLSNSSRFAFRLVITLPTWPTNNKKGASVFIMIRYLLVFIMIVYEWIHQLTNCGENKNAD